SCLERSLELKEIDMAPSATGSRDQLVKGLVESGLMSAAEARQVVEQVPASQRGDARAIARELVRRQSLTRYQAARLLHGKGQGLVLGPYVLLDELGQGGMGVVFKARHRGLQRIVALKVLRPESTQNEAALKRFRREVQAAAKLNHPNIV